MKREEIGRLSHMIVENLRVKKLAVFKQGEAKVQEAVEAVLTKNVEEEVAIDQETRRLMERYRAQVASGTVDPQKMYQMIKKQVAKERKFIL